VGESEQGGVGELEWERKTSTLSRTGQAWEVGVDEDGQDARLAVRGGVGACKEEHRAEVLAAAAASPYPGNLAVEAGALLGGGGARGA
jgi:hypothetical protein